MTKLPFKPKAMIFVLDGTLLDTEPLYSYAAQTVLEGYGHVFSAELKRRIIGGDSLQGAKMTVETYGLPLSPEEFLLQSPLRNEDKASNLAFFAKDGGLRRRPRIGQEQTCS